MYKSIKLTPNISISPHTAIFAPVQLSIIIVSYNVKYFLEQCLHSVRCAAKGLQAEVIVADNASDDDSIAYLQPRFPEVQFIASQINLGFAKACNLGWQRATGAYILFLNPDTLLAEDTLKDCLQAFKKHPQAGAAGVRMIDGSGTFLKESKRAFPGPLTSLYKLAGLARFFPHSKTFNRYYLGHLSDHQVHKADVLAGAFMMVPRTVLEAVGSFDEAFFMYGEDIDLSYRMQQKGYHNYYLGHNSIIHFKGESTERASLTYVRLFYAAMNIFVRKHYSGSRAGLFRAALQTAIGLRAAVSAAARLAGKTLPSKIKSSPLRNAALPVALACSEETYKVLSRSLAQKGMQCLHLPNLEAAADLQPQQMLVLCTDIYTYSRIIAFVQQCKRPLRFRFHAAGSGSIAGSDSSSSNGEVMAL